MMREIETAQAPSKWRKLALQLGSGLLFGGLVGYGAGYLAGTYFKDRGLENVPLSVEVAGLVAVIYVLCGAVVALGSLNPAVGAKLLNVEDEDEVREMRTQFIHSGAAMTLWGVALLALALAAPVGPLAVPISAAIGVLGLAAGSWFAWQTYRAADELMSAINLEAGALTYGLVLVMLGGWGMLAHLGYASGPNPLDLLTACYVLVIAATFIVVGRRGMLKLR
ncbi:MAG: hypothetical protein ACK4IS_06070 [Erythrobacter sp.]